MNHILVIFFSFVVGSIFQTVLFPQFFNLLSLIPGFGFLSGATLDVLLLMVVYHGLQRNFLQGFMFAAWAGVMTDAFGVSWKGAMFTNLLVLCLITTMIKDHIFAKSIKAQMILSVVFTFFAALLEWVWGSVFIQTSNFFQGLWGTMIRQMLLQALFAPFVFYILIRIDHLFLGRYFSERNVVFGEGD